MTRQHLLVIAVSAITASAIVACGSGSTSNGSQPLGGDASADARPQQDGPAEAAETSTSTDGAPDAGADVDNGAPSTNYPAPHPPLPTLTNANHGPVLTSPKIYFVFYPNDPNEAALQAFAPKLAASTYWATTTHEYGIGAVTYAGTIDLAGQTPPQNISSSQIQSWIESELATGAFGTPDPQGIYTVVYPQGTTITQPNPVSPLLGNVQSCVAFGGYHDDAQVTPDGGTTANYAYAVIPTCSTSIDDLTGVLSHEWVEASTDPQVTANGTFTLSGGPSSAYFTVDQDHFVWAVLGGGEAGDLCEPEGSDAYVVPPDIGHAVQRTWSNLAAMGSHDPCVPDPVAAFFDSAPVLNETVTFTSPIISSSITSKGVTIPVGQSKTIEVDLFSDGDTGGPWTVQADDVLYKYYGSYGLPNTMSFAWDRTSGVNGEKLHLTITVTQGSIVGNGHAFMITSTRGGRSAVWPGLVVE